MTSYITKRVQIVFKCVLKVFCPTLVWDRGLPRTYLDFPGLFLVFISAKAILDHKIHIWSILKL